FCMLGGELYLRLGTVLKPTLDLVLHGSSGDRCVIVGEGWEAVKECSDSWCGACRRITLTCSDPFGVAAPKTRLHVLPLRQGPMRHHPHHESPPGRKKEQDGFCLPGRARASKSRAARAPLVKGRYWPTRGRRVTWRPYAHHRWASAPSVQ